MRTAPASKETQHLVITRTKHIQMSLPLALSEHIHFEKTRMCWACILSSLFMNLPTCSEKVCFEYPYQRCINFELVKTNICIGNSSASLSASRRERTPSCWLCSDQLGLLPAELRHRLTLPHSHPSAFFPYLKMFEEPRLNMMRGELNSYFGSPHFVDKPWKCGRAADPVDPCV